MSAARPRNPNSTIAVLGRKNAAASAMLAALKRLHAEVGKTGWKTAAPIPSERNARANLLNDARAAIAQAEAAGIKVRS